MLGLYGFLQRKPERRNLYYNAEMQAIVMSVGDELALGQTVDTNSAHLSAELAKRGISTRMHLTVADDRAVLAEALGHAAERADLLLVTGGLGPTADDLTREALADAMGVELVEDAASLRHLEGFFRSRGRTMPDRNRVQVMHPAGSTMIENTCGTAPGIRAKLHQADVYVMPGVPREMRAMFNRDILPNLTGSGKQILTATLHTFGQGESTVAERLGELMARDTEPTVGTTVADGVCSVRLRASSDAQLQEITEQVQNRLGAILYGRDGQTLQAAVVALLRQRKQTVATAESCTGGLIGHMLTDIPGSSEVYLGGWVTYANAMKLAQLGIDPVLLEANGAVSAEVAQAMARNALQRSDSDFALAVTGIAGPEGGTKDKPVGTVYIALADQQHCQAVRVLLPGERDMVRDRAAKTALQMLRLHLLGESLDFISWIVPPEVHAS